MIDKQFYVYFHCRPDGTPFYVGKGHGRRAYELARPRNKHHQSVVAKYGRSSILVELFLVASEAEAFALETEKIVFLRANGFKLCNRSFGGEGPTGMTHSVATKQRISDAMKGRPKPESFKAYMRERNIGNTNRRGMKTPETTRIKQSLAAKGVPKSPEHRRNLSAGQKRRYAKSDEL